MARVKNNRPQYFSSGKHSVVSNSTKRAVRKEFKASAERMLILQKKAAEGKKAYITIENPNKEETNRLFIRVPVSQYFKTKPAERKA